MGAFLRGFYALIPRDGIQIFDENELEVYLSTFVILKTSKLI